MCIRDSSWEVRRSVVDSRYADRSAIDTDPVPAVRDGADACLLYTSDAADERSSVDLGGRRIIKKKKTKERQVRRYHVTIEEQVTASTTTRPGESQ